MELIVVDDDDDVRAITADFLAIAGYAVLQAEGGAQALAMLDDHPTLRLVITDIRMPQMSGIELANEAARRRPELRFIFISGYHQPQHLRWPFLSKPFRFSGLCCLIARELAQT